MDEPRCLVCADLVNELKGLADDAGGRRVLVSFSGVQSNDYWMHYRCLGKTIDWSARATRSA